MKLNYFFILWDGDYIEAEIMANVIIETKKGIISEQALLFDRISLIIFLFNRIRCYDFEKSIPPLTLGWNPFNFCNIEK